MATSSWTRRRAGLVVAASAAAVLTATSMAGAHEGTDDTDSIHACVANNGALRVLSDPGQDCRSNETALHWTVGNGGTEALDAFKAQLAASGGTGSLVDWSNLAGVPEWLADGEVHYDDLTGNPVFPAGSVDGSTVADGSLTTFDVLDDSLVSADIHNGSVLSEDLDADAVTGGKIQDGTVTAADLAGSDYHPTTPGAVTSEKILDGTVETRDLANGAVTPDKVTANVQATQHAAAVPLDVERLLPSLPAPVTAPANASIMITGQVQVSCSTSCAAQPFVWYELVRTDGTLVAGPYRLQLSSYQTADVASISALDVVTAAGSYAYQVRMSTIPSSADFQASNLVLVAHVLGT